MESNYDGFTRRRPHIYGRHDSTTECAEMLTLSTRQAWADDSAKRKNHNILKINVTSMLQIITMFRFTMTDAFRLYMFGIAISYGDI